jgi:hypothetical protein
LLQCAICEQSDSPAENDGDHGKRQVVDEARTQELLDNVPSIDVDMACTIAAELLDDGPRGVREKLLPIQRGRIG